jgi:drug/metabolite transporter (DMT)-like permease
VTTATIAGTLLALVAFAANSLLCRLALASGAIDPVSFTAIRLASGAAMLLALVHLAHGRIRELRWLGWRQPLALFLYALPFSLAYRRIGAGTGALVLFSAVQFTLLGIARWRGERLPSTAWLGFAIAAAGLVWLVAPSVQRPDPLGVLLMATAGVAWAAYTVLGRGGTDPLRANAQAFVGSSVLAIAALLPAPDLVWSTRGIGLAVASGALASALGYAVWYRVLPRLRLTTAAIAQLTVPPLAAIGGVLLLDETATLRLLAASGLVLGGVALAIVARRSK